MRLDLREEGAALAPALGPLNDLDGAGRARVIEAWRHRMVNETASARVFEALERQVRRAGLGAPWLSEVGAMAAEERDHGALCAGVVVALGGDPVAEVGPLPGVPAHEGVSPVEALLRNLLSVSCLSETTAVALLQAEAEEAGPPALRTLVRRILADEIGHARLGWRLLDHLTPTLDAATRQRLSDYLVPAFALLAETHLGGPRSARPSRRGSTTPGPRASACNAPRPPGPSLAARRLGACDDRGAQALVVATVEEVIIPALTAHGLDAAGAWNRAWTMDRAPASA